MLYIMRHGKTEWNTKYKLQGQTDIPLNDEGINMAREAHDEYLSVDFDYCFCSPLVRATETAGILLSGRDVPIIVDERLKEMSFGEYEGTEEVFEKPELNVRKLFFEPDKYVADRGAETLESLCERTGSFLNEVALPLVREGKNVLIVGHGAMNSAIITQVRGKTMDKFWEEGIPNCKLIRLI